MSEKSNTEVIIGGKVYTLSGYEGEDYLQKVASYINNKVNEFSAMESLKHIPLDMKATLIELNIADDLFKARERVEKLEQDLEAREQELYDMKHELISGQIRLEDAQKEQKRLEEENKSLLVQNTKLEAEKTKDKQEKES